MPESILERMFANQCLQTKQPDWLTEYEFHGVRKWKFDLAWPDYMIAVELEGGAWSQGRHTRGKGFTDDCFKYNVAAIMGWTVLRGEKTLIKSGKLLKMLEWALHNKQDYMEERMAGKIEEVLRDSIVELQGVMLDARKFDNGNTAAGARVRKAARAGKEALHSLRSKISATNAYRKKNKV